MNFNLFPKDGSSPIVEFARKYYWKDPKSWVNKGDYFVDFFIKLKKGGIYLSFRKNRV